MTRLSISTPPCNYAIGRVPYRQSTITDRVTLSSHSQHAGLWVTDNDAHAACQTVNMQRNLEICGSELFNGTIFTALHTMQGGILSMTKISVRLSVRPFVSPPSVRQSNACSVTKRKKLVPYFYTIGLHERPIILVFRQEKCIISA